MGDELLIPEALAPTGEQIAATEARKEITYRCPICRSRVILRAGEILQPHFAHRPDVECALTKGESWSHWHAKHRITQVVREDPKRVRLHRTCDTCGDEADQTLPDTIQDVAVEYTLPSGLRVDVMILGPSGPLCAIEIHQTHAVDREKAARLTVPWIELDAEAVLADPWMWRPRNENLKPWPCTGQRGRKQGHLLPVVYHGDNYEHTVVCPERKDAWRGYSYANIHIDCPECPYRVPWSWEGEEGAKSGPSTRTRHSRRFFSCASPGWDHLPIHEQVRYQYFLAHPQYWRRLETDKPSPLGTSNAPEAQAARYEAAQEDQRRWRAEQQADAAAIRAAEAETARRERERLEEQNARQAARAADFAALRAWMAERDITQLPLEEIRRRNQAARGRAETAGRGGPSGSQDA